MDKQYVKEIALANGFKLKEQPNGEMDLNPYVYQFTDALCSQQADHIAQMTKVLWLAHQTLEEFIGVDHNGNTSDAMGQIYSVANTTPATQGDEWISVKDQWPEPTEGNKVIGYGSGYLFECEREDGYWCNIGVEEFTHWMPLPHPPQVEGD